jgi:four helix bundle protein
MATYTAFEELEVWQLARRFARSVYGLTQEGSFARDFRLKDQINAATESVMSNIAEGFERDGAREFAQALSVSKGSAGEARSQLYTALDRNHISPEAFQELNAEALVIAGQLAGLMRYLKRTPYRGLKFAKEPLLPYLGKPKTPKTSKHNSKIRNKK